MAITQVTVGGRQLWRVAAAGLNGKSANSLCSTLKTRGGECFAYAMSSAQTKPASFAQAAKPAPRVAVKPASRAQSRELADAASSSAAKARHR